MDSFFVILPSNVKNGGTISRYTTSLPYDLNLSGSWEVALTEMYMPHSWNNVDSTNDRFEYYEGERVEGMPINTPPAALVPDTSCYEVEDGIDDGNTIPTLMSHVEEGLHGNSTTSVRIPNGYYDTIKELLQAMHASLSPVAKHNIRFRFNRDRTVSVFTKRKAYLYLHSELAAMLGFTQLKLKGKVTGTYASDEKRGMYSGIVYSDIVLPQVVGNVQSSVLRFVPLDGKPGHLIVHRFETPDYLPLARGNISKIDIEIRTDHGEPIVFQYGKIMCKLHFRPCHR